MARTRQLLNDILDPGQIKAWIEEGLTVNDMLCRLSFEGKDVGLTSLNRYISQHKLRDRTSEVKGPAIARLNQDEVRAWLRDGWTLKEMSLAMRKKGEPVSATVIQRYIDGLGLRDEEPLPPDTLPPAWEFVRPVIPRPSEEYPGTERLERQSVRRYRHPSPDCYLCGTSLSLTLCQPCVEGEQIPHDRQHHDLGYLNRKQLMERLAS